MLKSTNLACLLLLTGCISVFGVCPGGWTRYEQSCYHISRDQASWAEAMKMCEIHGSYLASIETAAENQYLKTILAVHRHTARFWVAGSDWDNEGQWKWAPHEIAFNFTNWHHGQPDNRAHAEHCLSLPRAYHYEWADGNCQTVEHYLCERRDANMTVDPDVVG